MSDRTGAGCLGVAAVFAGVFIGLLIAFWCYVKFDISTANEWKRQAVEHDAGEWVTDTSGNSKFKWKQEATK